MTTNLLARVEIRMREAIVGSEPDESVIARAAIDHLIAGGSRIRARLSLDANSQLGLREPDSITLASICELLHNASLIQDDLLDRAALRRGSPSVWAAHGDATAVCAGDLLITTAFAIIGELCTTRFVGPVLELVHRRTREIILGQGLEQTSTPETLADYETIAVAKSAPLLSLPLELALLLSGESQSLPLAQRAARAFATAYQMLDDLDDYLEDARTNSLNVISVVLRAGTSTHKAACGVVKSRIHNLLQSVIEDARNLPLGCGGTMIADAEQMRARITIHPEILSLRTGLAHHGE